MIAIPLPFVVSILLSLFALFLWVRPSSSAKLASAFAMLCALTTAIVGLRWSLDWAIFRTLQPILASLLPVCAWYCFRRAHQKMHLSWWHAVLPGIIALGALGYPILQTPLDALLTFLYIVYGVALLRSAPTIAGDVRLSDTEGFAHAERVAGYSLLFSALVDGALAISFMFYEGVHAPYILALSYAILLPMIVVIIAWVGLRTHSVDGEEITAISEPPPSIDTPEPQLTPAEAETIVQQFTQLLVEKQVFLDPDLTLNRLARKLLIPAKHISIAVNQIYARNLSKVINEYRIAYAQARLVESDDSITQIYLSSGFHSKSNFNREFSRITGQTPSQYRQEARNPLGKSTP